LDLRMKNSRSVVPVITSLHLLFQFYQRIVGSDIL
jgi:hypothetical protein